MLTNHDMDSRTPFATVLLGQPTLRRMIKLGVLAALDQRIAVRYQMTGMTPTRPPATSPTTSSSPAATSPLFSDDALALIHDTSRGKPRTVNNLALAALIATYVSGKKIVDQSAARAAVSEVISAE